MVKVNATQAVVAGKNNAQVQQANIAATVKTMGTTVTALSTNAAFLETLRQVAAPPTAGDPSTSAPGAPGSTYSQVYLTALANIVSAILTWSIGMAADYNDLVAQLQSAGIIS